MTRNHQSLLQVIYLIFDMKKLGFKSNLQFLIYINKYEHLPQTKRKSAKKIETENHVYQIGKNCQNLVNKAEELFLSLKDINLRNTTKRLFAMVYQSTHYQSRYIFFNQNYDKDNWDNFLFRLNSSKNMLKAVKEKQFYDAVMIHKQQLQQNGNDVLFWQKVCIIKQVGLYPSLEDNPYAERTCPTQWKQFFVQRVQINFHFWWKILLRANYRGLMFLSDIQRCIGRKKEFLKECLQSRMLTEKGIRQILLFFIWTTTKQQTYLNKIKDNQILIHENIQRWASYIKGISFQQSYIDEQYDQFKIFVSQMYEKIQLIQQGVQFVKKPKRGKPKSFVKYDFSNLFENYCQKLPYAKMEMLENEVIAEQTDLLAILKWEVVKIKKGCK